MKVIREDMKEANEGTGRGGRKKQEQLTLPAQNKGDDKIFVQDTEDVSGGVLQSIMMISVSLSLYIKFNC